MALLIRGMPCCFCGIAIPAGASVVLFPPFVGNEKDPLFIFNDAVFHEECFGMHPLSAAARARYERVALRRKERACRHCGRDFDGPDDYFIFDDYGSSAPAPLPSAWGRAFHISCLPGW